ncbi:hypothetical protein N9L68_06120, partial [bacterium]|nr:hypothetical protein [bacterium]
IAIRGAWCGAGMRTTSPYKLEKRWLRTYGRTSPVGGMFMSQLGLTISESGDAQRPLPLCAEGMAIVGSAAGTHSSAYSICLTHVSVVFTDLGGHWESRDVMERALVIDQQSGIE